ncbi:MAG: uroporphyrinogen-III C-methyltransferase [Eubacteriales bacterium]|nr:uroporphyrinogen-III C-methyltransferase [Eubacteriales bacterium]
MSKTGKVWIVGAGPGDAQLLTIKAQKLLTSADVVVYDALVSPEVICKIPEKTEQIYVGKRGGNHTVSQEEINQILLNEAQCGKEVLRLKGGDPFVFGRGGEELELLVQNGIPYEIVPGVTSAIAVPAYAGIPVTHRDFVSSVHIITGHPRKGGISRIDYPSLVKTGGTLIFLMGVSQAESIRDGLVAAGMPEDMPAAVIMNGTTAGQKCVFASLGDLPEKIKEAGIKAPAIIVVGEVTSLGEKFGWVQHRPLQGRTFLVTRPEDRISGLAEQLRWFGAQVIELPAICTDAIRENHVLNTLWEYKEGERMLVFTSPSGVRIFFESMKELKLDLRTIIRSAGQIKIAAIGSATAKELCAHGLFADIVPETFCAKELGKAIAENAEKDSEILILRAREGSDELLPPLEDAGLHYRDIPLYETTYRLHEGMGHMVKALVDSHALDGVLFTSKSTVRGFVEANPEIDDSSLTAICIGEQTAQEAGKYGMSRSVAKEATIASMIELILETFGQQELNEDRS